MIEPILHLKNFIGILYDYIGYKIPSIHLKYLRSYEACKIKVGTNFISRELRIVPTQIIYQINHQHLIYRTQLSKFIFYYFICK